MKVTLGEQIKIARTARGWTRKDLGEKVGVSDVTVHNWEVDKFYPRVEVLMQLEQALQTRLYVSGDPGPWEFEPEVKGKKDWLLPWFVDPSAVEMAILISRLPPDSYRAIHALATMAVSRDDKLLGDGLEINNSKDRSHDAKEPPEKPSS